MNRLVTFSLLPRFVAFLYAGAASVFHSRESHDRQQPGFKTKRGIPSLSDERLNLRLPSRHIKAGLFRVGATLQKV